MLPILNRILFVFIMALLTSCSMVQLRKDTQSYDTQVQISGWVRCSNSDENTPVILMIYSEEGFHDSLISYHITTANSSFQTFLPPGRYRIFVFEDIDKNFTYSPNEFAGEVRLIRVNKGVEELHLDEITLELHEEGLVFPFPSIPKDTEKITVSDYPMTILKEESLKSPLFEYETAYKGYWKPVEQLNSGISGLYSETTINPAKEPILFVHGAGGSPAEFTTIARNIDTTRYQPVYFYYPSGLRLSSCTEMLRRAITQLNQTYDIPQITIIAHSMGGLVAGRFIQMNSPRKRKQFHRFVTISTPWYGHAAAEVGVKRAPAVIPSWIDMIPGSQFQKMLLSEPIPKETDYYLLFSINGGENRFTGTNDGVVSIASQLTWQMQEEAKFVRGFNENHTSILKSEQMVNQLNQILNGSNSIDLEQKG